jgi:hypothetical protein
MIKALKSEINYQVLHLASWPPLSHLLHETAPHMTRICALLARRPSVGILIPVMLNIPPSVAHSLLETLHANGHIYLAGAEPPDLVEPGAESVQSHESTASSTFLAKLWQHLINKT